MNRVNKIIENEEYIDLIKRIDEQEKERIYCKHGYSHLMDVARMMYIEALEKGLDIDREVIYAAALLHDIGRAVSNENHDSESAKLAVHILELAEFNREEIACIVEAIESHRTGSNTELGKLLYKNDKLSRACYFCKAQDTCKWKTLNKRIYR